MPARYVVSGVVSAIEFTPVARDVNNGVVLNPTFTWNSSSPAVVTVDDGGAATVRRHGAATVTATAQNRSGSAILLATDIGADSTEIEVVSRDEVIRGAVFGFGPLASLGSFWACSYPGLWTSFPRGTAISVRASTTVPEDGRTALEAALSQLPEATNGALSASFTVTDHPNPTPADYEVTVTMHDSPMSQGCPTNIGCTQHRFERPGVFLASRVVLPWNQTANAVVHDALGHGILGMCHVNWEGIGRPANSLMSNGPLMNSGDIAMQLTGLDLETQKAVWASALDPGTHPDAFREAGILANK